MNVAGKPMRTIWLAPDAPSDRPAVEIIDQTRLPHELVIARLTRLDDAARAIRDMQVRGAPLIGATAAYGMALAVADDPSDAAARRTPPRSLAATRPTAVNLAWALAEMRRALADLPPQLRLAAALDRAAAIAEEDVAINRAIGEHGLELIWAAFAAKPGVRAGADPDPLQRRLAGGGRLGHRAGPDLPRPRRRHPAACLGRRDAAAQPGRRLTAWELGQHGVPHTVIADNAGGHLMQHGRSICASSAPTARPPRATSRTRSAPT